MRLPPEFTASSPNKRNSHAPPLMILFALGQALRVLKHITRVRHPAAYKEAFILLTYRHAIASATRGISPTLAGEENEGLFIRSWIRHPCDVF